MTPARLYALHERLVGETAPPFDSDGNARSVRPTPAGTAWLNDWHDYRRTWTQLHNAGQNPDALLKARFGYVAPSELDGAHAYHQFPNPEDDDGPEAA